MKTKKLIETISVGVPEELKSTWKFLTSLWLSSKNKRTNLLKFSTMGTILSNSATAQQLML
jgi:hypothetical protein